MNPAVRIQLVPFQRLQVELQCGDGRAQFVAGGHQEIALLARQRKLVPEGAEGDPQGQQQQGKEHHPFTQHHQQRVPGEPHGQVRCNALGKQLLLQGEDVAVLA